MFAQFAWLAAIDFFNGPTVTICQATEAAAGG